MKDNVVKFPATQTSCDECRWSTCCLVKTLDGGHSQTWSAARAGTKSISCGTHIFMQGEELSHVYVLKSGSAKSYINSEEGHEQIVAFHYPGNCIGFDAIASGAYLTSVSALETVSVCKFSFPVGEDIGGCSPELWSTAVNVTANQVMERNNHLLLLSQKSVHARFASFLLYLSGRYSALGCSGLEFNLTMSRHDIANYLSMAVETVSRMINEIQNLGAITVDRRLVTIVSIDCLRSIASGTPGANQTQVQSVARHPRR